MVTTQECFMMICSYFATLSISFNMSCSAWLSPFLVFPHTVRYAEPFSSSIPVRYHVIVSEDFSTCPMTCKHIPFLFACHRLLHDSAAFTRQWHRCRQRRQRPIRRHTRQRWRTLRCRWTLGGGGHATDDAVAANRGVVDAWRVR